MNQAEKVQSQCLNLRIAYVLLWFPLASETFVFREIAALVNAGLDIKVFTLYGRALKGCTEKMKNWSGPVYRMGVRAFFLIFFAWLRALRKRPGFVWRLMRKGLFRKMRNLEALGENIWSFFAGFLLAEKCLEENINLIHSAWANGPATAAWIASQLSGIPFAFTGRAGDIYPEDGLLAEKCADAVLIRTNNAANVKWLASFCPALAQDKVKLVYNSFTFAPADSQRKQHKSGPWRILAVGRFVRTKGFPDLLTAITRLRRENFPVTLTLVGDGSWRGRLEEQIRRQGLQDYVEMPGFVPNDKLVSFMLDHDMLAVPSVVYKNGDRDGIPNVIMEALSLDLPVVATDVCGIGEVVQNNRTGALVPQRKPALLARAIRQILELEDRGESLAKAGNELVRIMFSTSKNTQALIELYCMAAGTGKNGKDADYCCSQH